MQNQRFATLIRIILSLALVVVLVLGTTHRASAASIIYVKYNAGGANNGTSWANAYKSLQKALKVAVSGDQIWVAAGIYRPSHPTNSADPRTKTFALQNGVALYGGFAGTETSVSQRKWTTNLTILSGDIGMVGDVSDNAYHVVTSSSNNSTAILDGFKIMAGNANATYPNYLGSGIYNDSGSPTIRNLNISGNSAGSGGGMANITGSPTLTHVAFHGNSAQGGGGMSSQNGSPRLLYVTFGGNSAADGGGMSNQNASPSLLYVTFSENSATFGGGLYNSGDRATLNHVTFSGNSGARAGGGMYNAMSAPVLKHVTFRGNSAPAGGGMVNNDSNPVLNNVIFNRNSAGDGGGIYNDTSNPALTNVTFDSNLAVSGAGIDNEASNPLLTRVMFSSNSARESGGGM